MTEQINGKKGAGDMLKDFLKNRKNIAVRLLYTVIFIAVIGIITNLVWIIGALQYVFLLTTRAYIKPLRKFSVSLTVYLKEIIDYVLLTSNKKPFPFNEFPKGAEEPEPLDIVDIKD